MCVHVYVLCVFIIMCPCLWIFVFYFNSAKRWIKLYIYENRGVHMYIIWSKRFTRGRHLQSRSMLEDQLESSCFELEVDFSQSSCWINSKFLLPPAFNNNKFEIIIRHKLVMFQTFNPLMGTLKPLKPQPAQAPHRCTKCNSPPIYQITSCYSMLHIYILKS